MKIVGKMLPPISKTESEALDAGDSFIEAELFQGRLDVDALIDYPITALTEAEQSFLDNEVEELCRITDDYQINQDKDIPPETWKFLREKGFFGLEIPTEYGGLGFSTKAHSDIIQKIASRSVTLGVTTMVPNSIGPGKLIKKYGTQEQKDKYLRPLAQGTEFPCFALTSPHAGSDAGSITDTGVVFEKDGELFLRLNWDKRYITLCPVATLLGLAFQMKDPDGLLGDTVDIGITVALIHSYLDGVTTGNRHNPLGAAFMNGPTFGKDVVVPVSAIIGGAPYAGKGWKMLMESLAEGRGISLPALSVANMKRCSRIVGAYARVRKQFRVPIGKFEGIQDPLSRIAGNAYMMEAARELLASSLDQGVKPTVASAILKYEATERGREAVVDSMDILGGIGIMEGPNNFMANFYKSLPIGITVEGANILTRSLIMFGQGSVRCHPHLQNEIKSLQEGDKDLFVKSVVGHAKYMFSNIGRVILHNLTFGMLLPTAGDRHSRKFFRKMGLISVNYALLSDLALLILGGKLKRKERISGQFADVLSNLFLATCVLKRYVNEGCKKEDLPLLRWSMDNTLPTAKQAMSDILFKKDDIIGDVADIIINDSESRDNLTRGIYTNVDPKDCTGRIELAFENDTQENINEAIKVDHL
jgi:acyl-CoA dehydrogenase